MHDVVVIGSGPAGCAAAIPLRQYGLKTLIITRSEKNTVEAQPSESIHPGVASLLSKLNASHCISIASRGVYKGIQTAMHYRALGADEKGDWLGHHIDRAVFDRAMLQYAENQGAEVLCPETATEFIEQNNRITGVQTGSGRVVPCRYVLDASGYKRMAGLKLHFQEEFLSPPLVAWTGISEGVTEVIGGANQCARFLPETSGWTWLAPETPGRCSWTRLTLKGKHRFLPPDELKNAAVAGKIKIANRRWRIFRPLCREGIVLCGDAAAVIDPAAGLGIFNALLSGMLAAKTIKSSLANPPFEAFCLAAYDEWLLQHFYDKVQQLRRQYTELGICL